MLWKISSRLHIDGNTNTFDKLLIINKSTTSFVIDWKSVNGNYCLCNFSYPRISTIIF